MSSEGGAATRPLQGKRPQRRQRRHGGDGQPRPERHAGRRSRWGLARATALGLIGASLVLLALGRPWAVAVLHRSLLGPTVVTVTGGRLAPAVGALGLVGMAGSVAIVATRRIGRLLTGLLLLTAAVAAVAVVVHVRGDLRARIGPVAERGPPVPGSTVSDVRFTGWPVVAVAGAGLVAVAGALTVVRGWGWSALSARHEPPGPGPAPARVGTPAAAEPAGIWAALDRGEDPTG